MFDYEQFFIHVDDRDKRLYNTRYKRKPNDPLSLTNLTPDDVDSEMQQRKNPDGTPYYTTLIPAWNPGIFILIHYFNDRSETEGNLTPLYTSTVDVRYQGFTCEDERFDSSNLVNSYGKLGIARFSCNGVIQGWSVALENMHVGDTAEIIIPYDAAYGTSYTPTLLPYSSLRFNLRLEDIYRYEAPNN